MMLHRLAAIVILLLAGTAASVLSYLESREPEAPRVWTRPARAVAPALEAGAAEAPGSVIASPSDAGTWGIAPQPAAASASQRPCDRVCTKAPAASPREVLEPAAAAPAEACTSGEAAEAAPSRWSRVRRVGVAGSRAARSGRIGVSGEQDEEPAPKPAPAVATPPAPPAASASAPAPAGATFEMPQ